MENVTQIPGGRAFPEAHDGTPQNAAEKERLREKTKDKAESGEKKSTVELLQSSDLAKLKKQCADAINEIDKHVDSRSEINAKVQAIRETLQAAGIPKKALDAVMSVRKLDDDELHAFDVAYSIVRDSIGKPVQPELDL